MNEGKKELNIAIVGGGPGCKAILEMFEKEKFRELRANVIGVADVNENAVGYQYAKMKGTGLRQSRGSSFSLLKD